MPAFLLAASALAATPQELHAAGLAAAQAKDPSTAAAKFGECAALDPAFLPCQWELGWVAWAKSDWEQVVTRWRKVRDGGGDQAGLAGYLAQAEAHVAAIAAAKATTGTRPPLPAGFTLRLRAVGDLMIGSDFPAPTFPPAGAEHALDAVKDLLADADLTFGNLEGPLCDGGTTTKCKPGENCYAFRTPTRFAATYRDAGFDLASIANNHAEDFGPSCRKQTMDALDGVGIAWSGTPGTVATREVNGAKVGMVAFHTNPNSNYVNDPREVEALVRAASATHDLVIVSFHGGAEGSKAGHVPRGGETFYGENRGDLRAFARTAIGAGADLVLGHGPHVWRGLELVDGHLVAYSLGNFATYGLFRLEGALGTSAVLEVTLGPDGRLVTGKLLPTLQANGGLPAPDPAAKVVGMVRDLSAADFPDTAPVIDTDGAIRPR
jgi:poly-gamma-glutamate capsule biosynthesis protein CapA/YwtB (metallophosphatase superfamily)